LEHRFRDADGVYRWHLSRALALRDTEGAQGFEQPLHYGTEHFVGLKIKRRLASSSACWTNSYGFTTGKLSAFGLHLPEPPRRV
jgi:hypothetical protein